MSIGQTIRTLRKSKGWTQDDLEEASKVSRVTIANIERGTVKSPSENTLIDLARALGVTIEVLKGEPTPAAKEVVTYQAKKFSHVTPTLIENYMNFWRDAYIKAEDKQKIIDAIRAVHPGSEGDVFVEYCKKQ